MFPYIDTTNWHVGGLRFSPFPALMAIGIATGYLIATRRARAEGIGQEHFTTLGLCVIAGAFVGGHLAKLLYDPGTWRIASLFEVFNGQASFGSFIGGYFAAVGFFLWQSIRYRDWYLYADATCFALPFAWWIGRVGCYLVHDHPGIRTASFLGVAYPEGTRYDLGLLEALFLICLAALFLLLDRKPRSRGFFYVAFLFSYGLFRFFLDRLHVDPPRYGGWTLDQIGAGLMILTAAITILDLRRLRKV